MERRTKRRGIALLTTVPVACCLWGTPTVAVADDGAVGSSISVIPGIDRYQTAGRVATTTHATADTVVLASGTSYADALAASALAGDRAAPILLMNEGEVPAGTVEAYAQLQPSKVIVVGGYDRILDSAVARLTGGRATVTRIAGSDRYATAAAVGAQLSAVGTVGGKRTAFLATGTGFADAVSAGPAAAAGRLPVLLTEPTRLPGATAEALRALGIEHVVVLGDENAVGSGVAETVRATGVSVERLSGPDRHATATAVADWSIAQGFLDDEQVIVVRGDDAGAGADALSVAPLAAKNRAPVLLTAAEDDPSTASARWMVNHQPRTVSMIVVGNDVGVASDVLQDRRDSSSDQCSQDCTVQQWPTQRVDGSVDRTVRTQDITDVKQVVIGSTNVLARKDDGTVWGWGRISDGAGGRLWTERPVPVAGLSDVEDLAVSPTIGLGRDGAGRVWQFGWTTGAGGAVAATTPRQVALPARALDVSAEEDRGVAVLRDGSVWTWGADLAPTRVEGITDAVEVSSSLHQTTVLRANGSVWAFGWDFTTAPDGALTPDRSPRDLGWRGITEIEGSDYATYAVASDGTLSAWGWNTLGELGNGTTSPVGADGRTEPVFLPRAAAGISFVSAGGSHAVAWRADGTTITRVAWGANFSGETSPASADTVVPTPVPVTVVPQSGRVVAGTGTNVRLVSPD